MLNQQKQNPQKSPLSKELIRLKLVVNPCRQREVKMIHLHVHINSSELQPMTIVHKRHHFLSQCYTILHTAGQ